MENKTTITIPRVDLKLLRIQRNQLINLLNEKGTSSNGLETIDGLINLLDEMLDISEGFAINQPGVRRKIKCQ